MFEIVNKFENSNEFFKHEQIKFEKRERILKT